MSGENPTQIERHRRSFSQRAFGPRGGSAAPAAGSGSQGRSQRLLGSTSRDAGSMRGLAGTLATGYRQNFLPLQNKLASTAELDGESIAGQASIDVSSAFDRTQGEMMRDLSRMGINPNSGRFAGLQQKWGRAKAAATAGAMTRARRVTKSQNFGRLLQASQAGLSNMQAAGGMYGNAGNLSRGLANDWGDIAHGEAFQGALEKILDRINPNTAPAPPGGVPATGISPAAPAETPAPLGNWVPRAVRITPEEARKNRAEAQARFDAAN